jgi:hypothetical protein
MRLYLLIVLFASAAVCVSTVRAADDAPAPGSVNDESKFQPADPGAATPVKFKRITISKKFYSEGAGYGDFNKDGKLDYVAGGWWVEGPDFTKKRQVHEEVIADPAGYSKDFFNYAHDFNGDGWDDLLVIGFPGEETFWYANPKGKDGNWERHLVLAETSNESPTFTDLTGDNKPELVCCNKGQLGYATPDSSDPKKPWTWHSLSGGANDRFQRFTHGMGVGDVNGDGKMDLLEARGWWQQPGELKGDPTWSLHAYPFADYGGAQMYAYDVDGDGDNDVISGKAAHHFGLAWFENKGKDDKGGLKFEPHWILSAKQNEKIEGVQFSQPHAIALADVNGDGLKDIILGKRHWSHGAKGDPDPTVPPVVYWFELQRKDGKVGYLPHLLDDRSGVGVDVQAVDLNGDKKVDVVIANKFGQFVLIQE